MQRAEGAARRAAEPSADDAPGQAGVQKALGKPTCLRTVLAVCRLLERGTITA